MRHSSDTRSVSSRVRAGASDLTGGKARATSLNVAPYLRDSTCRRGCQLTNGSHVQEFSGVSGSRQCLPQATRSVMPREIPKHTFEDVDLLPSPSATTDDINYAGSNIIGGVQC